MTTRRSFLGSLLTIIAAPRELAKRLIDNIELTGGALLTTPRFLLKTFALGFTISPEMLEDELSYPIGALTMDIYNKQYLNDAYDRLDDEVDADYELGDEEDLEDEEDDDDYSDDDLQSDLEEGLADDEDEDDEDSDVADEDEFTDADLDEDDLDDED